MSDSPTAFFREVVPAQSQKGVEALRGKSGPGAKEALDDVLGSKGAVRLVILLQRRDVTMPRDRDLVAQIHAIKRRVLPSGKVSFDAERNARGHADRFWAVALACQRERPADKPRAGEIGVRVVG